MRVLVALLLLSVAVARAASPTPPHTTSSKDNSPSQSSVEKDSNQTSTSPPPEKEAPSKTKEPSGQSAKVVQDKPTVEPTTGAVPGSAGSGQQVPAANPSSQESVDPKDQPETKHTKSTGTAQQHPPADPKQESGQKSTKDNSDKVLTKPSPGKESPTTDKTEITEKGQKLTLTSKLESGERPAGDPDFSLKPKVGGEKSPEPTEDVENKETEEGDTEPEEEGSPVEEENEKVVDPSSNENRDGTLVESMNGEKDKPYKDNSGNTSAESSHFFAYLVTAAVLVAVLYIAYHNKRKIIAFALEGKRSKVTRRPKASDYQRLNLKGEEPAFLPSFLPSLNSRS
ncbi:trans-Golgi network integral membrane protein 2 [Sigmodon hispidus]